MTFFYLICISLKPGSQQCKYIMPTEKKNNENLGQFNNIFVASELTEIVIPTS